MKILPPLKGAEERDVEAFLQNLRDRIAAADAQQVEGGGGGGGDDAAQPADVALPAAPTGAATTTAASAASARSARGRARAPSARSLALLRSSTPLGGASARREDSVQRRKADAAGRGSRRERQWQNRVALQPTPEDIEADRDPSTLCGPPSLFHRLLCEREAAEAWDDDDAAAAAAGAEGPRSRWPSTALSRIDRGLRLSLLRTRVPVGKVKAIEDELTEAFAADADSVVIVNEPSAFNRALLHAVCQYLGLSSSSETVDDQRVTTVSNPNAGLFSPPEVLLSEHLKA